MNKRLVASLLTALLIIQSTAYAATNTKSNTALATNVQAVEEQKTAVDEETGLPILTLEEAIEKGMKNSLLYQLVENKSDIASVVNNNASIIRDDLANAEDDINHAIYELDSNRELLNSSEDQLNAAKEAYEGKEVPKEIKWGELAPTIENALSSVSDVQIRAMVTAFLSTHADDTAIEIGTKFDKAADNLNKEISDAASEAFKQMGKYPTAEQQQILYNLKVTEKQIDDAVKDEIDKNSNALAAGQEQLASGTQDYIAGQAEYQASLKYALSSVSNKLSTSTISSLEARPLGDLIVKMSAKQDEVYKYSKNIYKNQVALLVANSYFEALKQQELLKVKQKAEERGRVQYEMAQAAFEVGMKSKDDMNIAKTYYDSTIMNTELQLKEYNTALITLKKNMNVSYKDEFVLEALEPDTSDDFNLEAGIKKGLNARLEIKMAKANQDLYGYLMTAVNDSSYSSSSNQYKEVKLLQQQANIAYNSAQATVESDIRTSYQAVQSTKKLVETAKDLRANAETTVENAKAKYEAGYGYTNSLLASLNLGQMSGTMVEILAAEENLETIEEKQIEAMNGYNLARLKYLNDIGELPYK